ncbi:MAG: HD domain-containing phosphohydrolase [Candidatus Woesearchaeota archaeon]
MLNKVLTAKQIMVRAFVLYCLEDEQRASEAQRHMLHSIHVGRHVSGMMPFIVEKYTELMTPDYQRGLEDGAVLHDIGKSLIIGNDASILADKVDLTTRERFIIENHTELGTDVLLASLKDIIPYSKVTYRVVKDIIRFHHAKYDAECGCPRGVSGENIPLLARIVAVPDYYDAMADRTKLMTKEQVLKDIPLKSGTWFDPSVVDIFLKYIIS